jgi:hypothetical protein
MSGDRQQKGRVRWTGGAAAGISMSVHAGLGVAIAVLVQARPVVVSESGGGETGLVNVELATAIPTALAEPSAAPAAPARLTLPPLQIKARPQEAVRAVAAQTELPLDRASVVGNRETLPPIDPVISDDDPELSTPRATHALDHHDDAATIAAAPAPSGTTDSTAQPAHNAPVYITPDVATYLREQDFFPSMPASLRHRGARYQAKLDICVSVEGRVTDVGLRHEPTPALDKVLTAAIRGWRYRPLIVDGHPAPFCHHMVVSYEMS